MSNVVAAVLMIVSVFTVYVCISRVCELYRPMSCRLVGTTAETRRHSDC